MKRKPNPDPLRELRRATRAVKEIKRDISEILGEPQHYAPQIYTDLRPPSSSAVQPLPEIPQEYCYVRCKDCDEPAILVRDVRNNCYAACCLRCSTISHLETIDHDPAGI